MSGRCRASTWSRTASSPRSTPGGRDARRALIDAMQSLFPPSDTRSNVDVNEFFGRDWLESGGVRVNFIASVDGAVTIAGKSRGLQTPGDNLVFAALRDLADVVLVGAGT